MAWTDLSAAASGTPPPPRTGHGFTAAGGRLYVHGGWDANYNPLRDLHAYDPVAMAWTNLSSNVSGIAPSPRYGHGFKAAGAQLYVHGGFGEAGPTSTYFTYKIDDKNVTVS